MGISIGRLYSAAVQRATALPCITAQVGNKPACSVQAWGTTLGAPGAASSGIRQYLRNTGLRAAQFGGSWPALTLPQHKYLVRQAAQAGAGDATAQAGIVLLCKLAASGHAGAPVADKTAQGGWRVPSGAELTAQYAALVPAYAGVRAGKLASAARKGAAEATAQAQQAAQAPAPEGTAQVPEGTAQAS